MSCFEVEVCASRAFELVEFGLQCVVVGKSSGPLHLADDRKKRAIGVLRRTKVTQARVRFAGKAFKKCRYQSRFADAGLARKQHHLAFAVLRLGPAPQHQVEFFLSADEVGQAGRVQRLKPAFYRCRSHRRPSTHRPGDAL